MKKFVLLVAALAAGYLYYNIQSSFTLNQAPPVISEKSNAKSDALIDDAYANHKSNLQVSGQGIVTKLLPDDNRGSRHQKFLIKLPSGLTLLVAHNIDLAPRMSVLRVGDTLEFYGEYAWNSKGGVIHWTHRDPNGRHVAGWLQHQGRKYQ